MRFIQVGFAETTADLDSMSGNLLWLRSRVSEIVNEKGFGEVPWGVTGIPGFWCQAPLIN